MMKKRQMINFYDNKWSDPSSARGVSATLRRRQIIKFIEKYTPASGLTILDFGCGRGHLTNTLSRFGQVTGVDFAVQTIEENHLRYPHIRFVAGDVTDLSLPSRLDHYDLVVSSEVIEHLEIADRAKFLQNIYTVLYPQGKFIITTPHKDIIIKSKPPEISEQDFIACLSDQPIDNLMYKKEVVTALKSNFEIVEFTSVQPLVRNRILDLLWKGLFWPLNYKFVNALTSTLGFDGQYMVVASRKSISNNPSP